MHTTTLALLPESGLGLDVGLLAPGMTRHCLNQVIIVRCLSPLVERVLTTTSALPWLHSLQAVSNVSGLRAGS